MSAPLPIERAARAVRPPYDLRDDRLDHLDGDAWRVAVRLDRLGALLEPLAGLPLSDYEHRVVEHLAGDDIPTVAVLARLLWAARLAEPIPAPVPDR